MKTKLLAMMLLAGGSMFAQTRFSVGLGFNPAPRAYVSNIPPCPGPGYVWLNGYWHAPAVRVERFDNRFRGGFERGREFNGHERGFRNGFHGR